MPMVNDSILEKADAVWSANQMLAWHLARQPLPWRNWSADMYRELPRAQLALSKELGGKKRIARGTRPGSQGASEPIPDKLFRLGFPVVVDPTGYLRTLHPRDQHKFEEFKIKYRIPEWSGIEFDSDETSTPAVDAPIAPAEPQSRTLIETGRVVWLKPPA